MKKTTVVISAALTAFILLILAGVGYSARQGRAAEAAGPQLALTQEAPTADFTEREAAYQELIRQANQRLTEAQAEIQNLKNQQGQSGQPAAVATPAGITIEQATWIAAGYLGQSEIYSAEGVAFDGIPAYRVTFSSGDVVIVSSTGEVISVQPAPSASFSASAHSDDDAREGDEHEEHEGDDDFESELFEHED